jgi:AmmeMemoRadiSam system protein B
MNTMAQPLPRLRMNLEFMPSPIEDRPGLLIRDSYGYSEVVLIIPPPLVSCLECFDGEQTDLELRQRLVEITGELDVSAIQTHLKGTLAQAGFLHDELFEQLREARHSAFANAALREPAHAGSGYPEEREAVARTLAEYMLGGPAQENGNLIAIAAPHVSPVGGWQTYRSAYSALGDAHRDRTFVVLGTSHYGEPNRFGLTRKPFVTPYGEARTELSLVDELAKEPAAVIEDYCHAIEHSIEFQVLFLQHLFGAGIRILPVLCGSFAHSICNGGKPEDDENVRAFLDRLGEIGAREGQKLLWVLGIDMAHMGARYGDSFAASANSGIMTEVARRDSERMDQVMKSDPDHFWSLVQENEDDLKWCGSSPMYTFLRSIPGARGSMRGYEQWNIDAESVVSFAAMSFQK